MEIDYGKIVTNALSALVAATFVGAAVIVWNAATSIDTRIEDANSDIMSQQAAITATQKTIIPELAGIRKKMEDVEGQLKSISKILSESTALQGKISYNPTKPFVLDEFREKKDPKEWIQAEQDRLNNEINTKQMLIYDPNKMR
jgi:hypothetical protein